MSAGPGRGASEGASPGECVGPESELASVGSVAALDSLADPGPASTGPAGGAGPRSASGAPTDPGRFRVGPEIGAGGMGRVSLVHDLRLLRDVAWKRGDWRLLREARILAQLEHPGIVPIHDMGFDPDGQAFFSMRVVRGRSLARVLRATPVSDRLGLLRPLLQAAEAVAYAHHRGVVHRDLKPANVMIGHFGESQVVDWGLARVLGDADNPLPEEVRRAVAGDDAGRVGTPGYMSPEQAAGQPADRRSDVYGLGRMLERIIALPSGTRGPEPSAELRAIAAKSTAADPDDRYPDAAALAADLVRFLDGRRVSAHSYGQAELIRRFVHAHRAALAIVAAGLVALLVFGAVYVVRLGEERVLAQRAASETRVALQRSDEHLARSLVGEARRLLGDGARVEAEVLAAHALTLAEDPDARALLASVVGAPTLELVSRAPLMCPEAQIDAARALVLCPEAAGLALWSFADGTPRRLWERAFPLRVARLVDGGVALGSSATTEVLVLDLEGREAFTARAPNTLTRKSAADGSRAVFESARISVVVDVRRREVVGLEVCGGALHAALVVSPDPDREPGGAQLSAALCRDGTLQLEGRVVATPLVAPEREGFRMALSGRDRAVVGTTKGEVVVLDGEGRVVHGDRVVKGMVRLVAPSPDGHLLAVAGEGDPIVLLTLPDLARIGSLPRRAKSVVWDVARPGELVSAGTWLERWRLSPADRDRPLWGAHVIPLDDGVVSIDLDPSQYDRLALAFGPFAGVLTPTAMTTRDMGFVTTKTASLDGATLLAGGIEGLVALDAETLALRTELTHWAIRRGATLDDGSSLIADYGRVHRLVGGRLELIVDAPPLDLSASPNRRFAVVLREADRALLRVRSGVAGYEMLGADPGAEAVAITSAGDRIYTARRGEVAAWDEGGHLAFVLRSDDTPLLDVETSLDGRWVAAGARDGAVFLWDVGHSLDSTPRARFYDHTERVPALAFSPSGRWFVSGSWDRTLRVRDLGVLDAPVAPLAHALQRHYRVDLMEALGGPHPSPQGR